MTFIQSPVKRFVKRLLLAISILFTINILLFAFYAYRYKKSVSGEMFPIPSVKQLSQGLVYNNNYFELDSITKSILHSQHIWAMLLDDRQGSILWSYDLPKELPQKYTLSDIALLSRYYLKDYPVFTWKHPNGLLILGFPKGRWSKVTGMLPLSEIKNMPLIVILIFIFDLLILALIYFVIDKKTLKNVTTVLSGIQSLANGKLIHLEETGLLFEIASQLNRTSNLLEARSNAQQNWIAGVSHDVRTPLSVIIGYAEQIEQNSSLPGEVCDKATNIKLQGVRLRNLINDLNLATRLKNENTILQKKYFHPVSYCRNLLADFLNDISNERFSVEIDIDKETDTGFIWGDSHLLQRAFNNLLYNSVRHNPNGCNIYFKLQKADNSLIFILSDNGKGLTVEQFQELRNRPHYLSCNESTLLQQHGLGLYVVQQIIKLHDATISFDSEKSGGFQTTITIPFIEKV